MSLRETCRDCDWSEKWDGGTAAEDPGVAHAKETGHTVTTEVAEDEPEEARYRNPPKFHGVEAAPGMEQSPEQREQEEIGDYPHYEGITRGTVLEYDDWQWALVTEIAEDYDPAKVGFVLLDDIEDVHIKTLESAWGCWEHYHAVQQFRDTEHEYWTDIEYVLEDDIWTVIGPIHPDTRTDGDDEPPREVD